MTSNRAFSEAIGVDESFASKLRNGQRLPGVEVMARICETYNLDMEEITLAYRQGRIAMGRFLRENVFNLVDSDSGSTDGSNNADTA